MDIEVLQAGAEEQQRKNRGKGQWTALLGIDKNCVEHRMTPVDSYGPLPSDVRCWLLIYYFISKVQRTKRNRLLYGAVSSSDEFKLNCYGCSRSIDCEWRIYH